MQENERQECEIEPRALPNVRYQLDFLIFPTRKKYFPNWENQNINSKTGSKGLCREEAMGDF